MLICAKRKKLGMIKMENVYFCDDYRSYQTDADIVMFFQSKNGPEHAVPFHTLLIDLEKSYEEIQASYRRSLRKKIRNETVQNSGYIQQYWSPGKEQLQESMTFINQFYLYHKLQLLDEDYLEALRQNGNLLITNVYDAEDQALCVSSISLLAHPIVRGMYGVTNGYLFPNNTNKRNRIGNLNRLRIAHIIQKSQERGYKIYDMGGLTLNPQDEHMSGIDRFKLAFGGEIVTQFHFYYPITLLGKVALKLSGVSYENFEKTQHFK